MTDNSTHLETIRSALRACSRSELQALRGEIAARDAELRRENERQVAAEIRRLARSINARVDLSYARRKPGRALAK